MMQFFVGVDAGGTSTRCVIIDETGTYLASAIGGSGNIAIGKGKAARNIVATISRAAKRLGALGAEPNFSAIFLGMAGINSKKSKDEAKLYLRTAFEGNIKYKRLEACSDTRILQTASFYGGSGIVYIGGTGSNCYGVAANGREMTAGGLDYILADEGSSYDLGLRALKYVIRFLDGRSVDKSILADAICERLDIVEYGDFSNWLYSGSEDIKNAIANLAPFIDDAVKKDDLVAKQILRESMAQGSELVAAVVRGLDFPTKDLRIGITGGTVTSPICRPVFEESLRNHFPEFEIFIPTLSPVAGGALRALQLADIEITPAIINRLRNAVELL